LNEAGYAEGKNLAIEYRWADGHYDRLPELAADLVRRRVALITTLGSTPAALAAKAATTTIPVVFFTGGDPLQVGLVASLSRPGGNITGVTSMNVEVGPKRLELLHEVVPSATQMALLVNPTSPILTELTTKGALEAARTLGVRLHVLHASNDDDCDAAFATLSQLRVGALVIGPDAFLISRGGRLGALALRYRVPTAFQYRPFVAEGGLVSYGSSTDESYRWVGIYAGRVLKGEKPSELPVQQITKLELILNLKAATALGIEVPRTILERADQVIE
jgi:putative ABC transport system substrate-binding protein